MDEDLQIILAIKFGGPPWAAREVKWGENFIKKHDNV